MLPPSPLVTATDLRAAIGQPTLVLLDASFNLADATEGEATKPATETAPAQ